jgi:ketosteroid isomerase-like protein
MRTLLTLAFVVTVVCGCATPSDPAPDQGSLRNQVMETERAFAKTMADRNFAAFKTFIADDAVFLSNDKALRGKQQVANAWRALYESPKAPFSWEPAQVEVLDSGRLALSTGPVRDATGKLVATFTSIWRLESPATWRIVFDKGNDVCYCAAK